MAFRAGIPAWLAALGLTLASCPAQLPPLQVAAGGRHFETAGGRPFFWLGDTAWELLHRLTREEIIRYLDDRAGKGFNVVQVALLPEINGLTLPNAYGQVPLLDRNPRRPNPEWFALADFLVSEAARRGLYVALLPTWGAYAVEEKHPLFEDHFILKPREAFDYGRFLGDFFRGRSNVVWMLGGDRQPDGYEETWRALATGLEEGNGSAPRKLKTYHPSGPGTLAGRLHDEAWLDFNLVQSGHRRASRPGELVAADYARTPAKPVLNGEPGYEAMPDDFKDASPRLNAADVRRFAFESVFAGAAGHAYGANEIWMMWRPEHEPIATKVRPPFLGASRTWWEALDYPGAAQMGHLRRLLEETEFATLQPDAGFATAAGAPAPALRAPDGSRTLVYLPAGAETLRLAPTDRPVRRLRAEWFDPREGRFRRARGNDGVFASPDPQLDWVLRLNVPR